VPDNKQSLEYLFHPRSVAVVGVSTVPGNFANEFVLQGLLQCGYQGEIYPVNRRVSEIKGLKAYSSLMDTPGPVDYLYVSIPASSVPQLLKESIAKGVKATAFYTAGFGELGDEEGRDLEAQIVEIARQGGIRLIGPNGLGIYCPRTGLAFSPTSSNNSGPVGALCQSGGVSLTLIDVCEPRGIHFSKLISYGNATDLNEVDFLEYFTNDPETEIIAAYIEGVKDGPRFVKVLKEAAATKPVLILKGGTTAAGKRAVSSHTGALAGDNDIWNTIFNQTGVIQADDLNELIDLLMTFRFMPPLKGQRLGVIGAGSGGGMSVLTTDVCERAGLIVPHLSNSVREELLKFTAKAGTSVRNPIDCVVSTAYDPKGIGQTIKVVASSPEIDALFIHFDSNGFTYTHGLELLKAQAKSIIQTTQESGKPTAVVIRPVAKWAEMVSQLEQKYLKAGLPVYSSETRAATAIAKFIQYHQKIKGRK